METAHKRHCWISFPQQDNASLEYLFLVTICFYSEQSLTSYYVSIFYNKNSSVKMDNNTPIPAPSPCSVLQGKRGIKMTDAPATGAGGTRWWFKRSFWGSFLEIIIMKPSSRESRWKNEGWLAIKWPQIVSPWLDPHSRYTDFWSQGSQLGTWILTPRSDSVLENSLCDPGEAEPGGSPALVSLLRP